MAIIGSISITLAILATLPCFAPGAVSMLGVFTSLLALIISCLSSLKGNNKYLISVLIIVTFNIFIVSEFSFSLSKQLYSHTETPLRKAIYFLKNNEKIRQTKEKNLQVLEKQFGDKLKVDYTNKQEGYKQFVNMVFLIVIIPYSLAIFRLYYLRQESSD